MAAKKYELGCGKNDRDDASDDKGGDGGRAALEEERPAETRSTGRAKRVPPVMKRWPRRRGYGRASP